MKRYQIKNRVLSLRTRIAEMTKQADKLEEQYFQLPGKNERVVMETIRGKEHRFIGWKEKFVDESNGDVVTIDRLRRVAVDGIPCDIFGRPMPLTP